MNNAEYCQLPKARGLQQTQNQCQSHLNKEPSISFCFFGIMLNILPARMKLPSIFPENPASALIALNDVPEFRLGFSEL